MAVAIAAILFFSRSKEAPASEPVVAVQMVKAERKPIRQIVTTEAILFPRKQAAVTPKITAPVRKFYVNRGSRVHAGELLAVLENRDLAAAVTDSKGAFEQAQATYQTTTGANLPEDLKKSELDLKTAQEALDAEQKLYDSREALFNQGALPRKELDQAACFPGPGKGTVPIGEPTLRSGSGNWQAARREIGDRTIDFREGKVRGSRRAVELHRNSKSDRWSGYRPSFVSGRNPDSRYCAANDHGYVVGHCEGAHTAGSTRPF